MNPMKLSLAFAMLVFGSIGLFVRHIVLSSAQISLLRGAAGAMCLFLAAFLSGGVSWASVRANLKYLLFAGAAMGANWIFFFEALRLTSIATATICYYLAPVFLLCLAPFFLKEKLRARTVWCVLISLGGLACVALGASGSAEAAGRNDFAGILCGLAAAVLYAAAIVANKFLRGITPVESTAADLLIAAVFLAPYVFAQRSIPFAALDGRGWFCLLMLCFFHTGFAYLVYFRAMRSLPAQTTAALSYIDPLSAILMGWLVLGESLSPLQMLGGALIFGATFWNEMKRDA